MNIKNKIKNQINMVKLREASKRIVPVVFATDDNYAPFLVIAIHSMVQHLNKNNTYKVYILHTNISDKHKTMINKYASENLTIEFVNITKNLEAISKKLYLRDYYTKAIYYRLFIPNLFPQYKKAVYLDCDIVILDDIAKLYNHNLKDKVVGAIEDDVVAVMPTFGEYVEKMVGVNRYKYFNSGVMVMNLEKLRKNNIEDKFINLLSQFRFIIAPDQDLFNALFKGKVLHIHRGWNKCPLRQDDFDDSTLKIAHYKMALKPWIRKGVPYEDHFWKYAKDTEVYEVMLKKLSKTTDEDYKKDAIDLENLKEQARKDSSDPLNYYNTLKKHQIALGREIDPFYELYDFSVPVESYEKEECELEGIVVEEGAETVSV